MPSSIGVFVAFRIAVGAVLSVIFVGAVLVIITVIVIVIVFGFFVVIIILVTCMAPSSIRLRRTS